MNIYITDKHEDKEEASNSSETSKSPPRIEIPNGEKTVRKPSSGCNELLYNYQSPTDNGEMKRFLFNDFVAHAAVANAGIIFRYSSFCKMIVKL